MPENIEPLWNDCHQQACEQLRVALLSKPVLRAPDPKRSFILSADASIVSVAATLSQIDDKGDKYAIGYCSRKLLPRERNYSVIELECLAIITGIRKFE
jgi:hypothetical protein